MVKKLLRNPETVIEDMVAGIMLAYPHLYKKVGPRALVRKHLTPNKVAVVIGGGSGHEPAFLGYVGAGLADGVALGNVFASPPPDPIIAAAAATESGKGVLLLYGNYAGDIMNFEMASELLQADGIQTACVVINDDVASAPKAEQDRRRGIAGEIFVYKIAGAAAENGKDLAECERLARKTVSACRSMGAAWSPCYLPQTGRPSFELGANEMELGLGVHGEPGVERMDLQPADRLAVMMAERILADYDEQPDEVCVLVNGLGSTSMMELMIFYQFVHQYLEGRGIKVYKTLTGEFITSQEMGGCSLTLMALDEELKELLDAPSHSIGLAQT